MLINNCNDCTAYMYMQVKFRNNPKALIIEGAHTDAELSDAFTQICIEYLDAAGIEIEDVSDREEIVKLQARFTFMQNSIRQQEVALGMLGEPFHEGLGNFSRYSYLLQWKGDIAQFRKDLEVIKMQERPFVVMLEDAVAIYQQKETNKDAANRGQVREIKTEADFVRMLTELSKFQGYHLKPKEISMMELAGLVRTLNDANAEASSN